MKHEAGTTREERIDAGESQMVCSNFCRCAGTREECACLSDGYGACKGCKRSMREIWIDTGETVRRSA